MIPLLAKNAVAVKVGFDNAKMTGNYECAYALGVLAGAAGIEKEQDFDSVPELKRRILEKTENFQIQDERLKKMVELLKDYDASEGIDDQMKELYNIGYIDKKL